MRFSSLCLFAAASSFASIAAHAAVTFNVSFTAQALADLSGAEQALFTDGLQFWDGFIEGRRDGVNSTWTLTVDTFSQAASGGGVLLGSAGPSGLVFSGVVGDSHTSNGRFILSTSGSASFNIHPDAGALQAATIRHEIGHALGIGTLWEDNEIYNDGVAGNHNRTLAGGTAGQLVGPATLAAYQAEFDAGATFVPIELDGGPGTANGHWNEVLDNIFVENTPGLDGDPGDGSAAPMSGGLSLDDELMTGLLSGSAWISNTTIANLHDLGYNVVPEPGTTLLLGAGVLLLGSRRRRS